MYQCTNGRFCPQMGIPCLRCVEVSVITGERQMVQVECATPEMSIALLERTGAALLHTIPTRVAVFWQGGPLFRGTWATFCTAPIDGLVPSNRFCTAPSVWAMTGTTVMSEGKRWSLLASCFEGWGQVAGTLPPGLVDTESDEDIRTNISTFEESESEASSTSTSGEAPCDRARCQCTCQCGGRPAKTGRRF